MSSVVIILSTIGVDADAATLAQTLVEEHLAACVNVLPPMQSIYRWNGSIQIDPERQLIVKTTRDRVAALEVRLRELHPYELPEFVVLEATASQAYAAWVRESVGL